MRNITPRGPKGCMHQKLAASPICRVEQCEHGTVHMSLGDVTLRLRPSDFQQVADTLGIAAARLTPPEQRPMRLC